MATTNRVRSDLKLSSRPTAVIRLNIGSQLNVAVYSKYNSQYADFGIKIHKIFSTGGDFAPTPPCRVTTAGTYVSAVDQWWP